MAVGAITHFIRSFLAGFALCAAPASARGQQIDTENPPPPEERTSASNFEATWTHFVTSAVAGEGSSAFVYPARGWGLFGTLSLWDANPTPLRWSMNIGMIGSPPIASRPRDRFGLAYFRVSLSEVLRDGLAPILALGPEKGAEAFYTLDAARGHVRTTLTAQIIDPKEKSAKTAALLGLRTLVRF